ncbi:MAG: hypothetical protein AAF705_18160, partial [Bacteroidota bacterium]
NIDADNAGSGILSYSYGNVFGSRQLDLEAGTNAISLPIPPGSINNWLYQNANFRFVYLGDDCQNQSSVRQIPICELDQDVSLGVNNPTPNVQTVVDFAMTTTCVDQTENVVIRPTFRIFYKESCQTNAVFRNLIWVTDGAFNGNLPITIGETYDFRIQYGTSIVNFEDVTIPVTSGSYIVDEQTLSLELMGGVLMFHVDDYQLPENICKFISG